MRPSCEGVSPHSQRTAGPRNDSSIISIASAAHAQPQYSSSTTWKRPKPAARAAGLSVLGYGLGELKPEVLKTCASHSEPVGQCRLQSPATCIANAMRDCAYKQAQRTRSQIAPAAGFAMAHTNGPGQ